MGVDHSFDRDVGKERIPTGQNQGLPQLMNDECGMMSERQGILVTEDDGSTGQCRTRLSFILEGAWAKFTR